MIKLTKFSTAFLILIISSLVFTSFLWFVLVLSPFKASELAIQIPKILNTKILATLPSDLQIQANNGQVQLNQASPTCFFEGLIYDAKAKPDSSLLRLPIYPGTACAPGLILGSTFLMIKDKDHSTRIYDIPRNLNFSITAGEMQQFVQNSIPLALPILTTLYYIVPIFMLLPVIFLFLVSSLFYATILSISQKFFHLHPSLNFGHNYAFSLSIFCLLNLFFLFLVSAGIHLSFPFLNTILILICYLILSTKQSQSPQDSDPIPLSRHKSRPKRSSP